jgi:hypothetical protein
MSTVSCACAGQAVKRMIAVITCGLGFIDLLLEVRAGRARYHFRFPALGIFGLHVVKYS